MTSPEPGDNRPHDPRPAARTSEPGDRRPTLERPPGERYVRPTSDASARRNGDEPTIVWPPFAVAVGAAVAYTLLGGVLDVTAGLIVVAAFAGWLLGRLVSPPARAAISGVAVVILGLAGIWLFSHIEGGVLNPIDYFDEVQGWPLVAIQLLAGAGLAAASSRGS